MKNHPRGRCALVLCAMVALAARASRADAAAPTAPATFSNPILPGFYPDPSVCRVGADFYLVTSTFEYFPGVPIFHSRDLVHWRQLGHVLDRPSQLDLDGVGASDGIYAPTLRCHRGTFYMVTTVVRRKPTDRYTNFVVTAKDPAGPWSEPHVLAETFWRIDPSLFFDDDGRAYYIGNRTITPAPYPSHRMISLQELDLATMKLKGPVHDIGEGHARFASAPEAPHVYKKDGFYYLLVAEGGTFETHAVTISRSKTLTGPYEQYQGNPILTHRHLGPGVEIHSTGHADLVDTASGDWWMVALGMRGNASTGSVRGRETFLVPVSWPTGGWPVVNPGVGRILAVDAAPRLPVYDPPSPPATDHFDGDKLSFAWNFLRTPRGSFWSLRARPGFLRLSLKQETIAEDANPAFIGRRIQHADFIVRTKLDFATKAGGDFAGLVLRNGKTVIRFGRARAQVPASGEVVMVAGSSTIDTTPLRGSGSLYLKIECRRETECRFFHALTPEGWQELPTRADTRALGHKAPGALFTGAYVGLYATAAGQISRNTADFDWFEYRAE